MIVAVNMSMEISWPNFRWNY